MGNLADLRPQEDAASTPVKTFKDDEPGLLHVHVQYLPQMPEEDARTDLFVAIDRAQALGLPRTPPREVRR